MAEDRSRWPAHVQPLSWLAGMLDARGVFELRVRGGEAYGARVYLVCGGPTAQAIVEHTKLGAVGSKGMNWYIPARAQADHLKVIIPYLRIRGDDATRILQFRLTSPGQGSRLSDDVARFRQQLAKEQHG